MRNDMEKEAKDRTKTIAPFSAIRKARPIELLNILRREMPQTIAVVMSRLEPNKASLVLQNLDESIRTDVVRRVSELRHIDGEDLREIERVIEKKLSADEDFTEYGGVATTVEMLNLVDRAVEKAIIEALEDEDPELAEEIKNRMFIFEDIVMLHDRDVRKVLESVDQADLAKAMVPVDSEVREKIFKAFSRRAAAVLAEDIVYLGQIRLKDCEDAQQKIVSIIRRLENDGVIIIARAGHDELVSAELNLEKPKGDKGTEKKKGLRRWLKF
jgi:flagellar motor switch protein FliG